jgi:hypothetical protein
MKDISATKRAFVFSLIDGSHDVRPRRLPVLGSIGRSLSNYGTLCVPTDQVQCIDPLRFAPSGAPEQASLLQEKKPRAYPPLLP